MTRRPFLPSVSAASFFVLALAIAGCGGEADAPGTAERGAEHKVEHGARRGGGSGAASTADGTKDGGTAVGGAFAEAELRPVGDSVVSGTAVFKEVGSLGVQVELEVSGLPAPGNPEEPKPYFAQVHEGACSEAPRGDGPGHEGDHGGDHGHDHGHGGGGPSLASVRLDRFLGATPEYADHAEYEDPPADGLPGDVDAPLSVAAADDGTGAVASLLEGVEPGQLTAGGPKYLDLRVPSHDLAPDDWPALACADLG